LKIQLVPPRFELTDEVQASEQLVNVEISQTPARVMNYGGFGGVKEVSQAEHIPEKPMNYGTFGQAKAQDAKETEEETKQQSVFGGSKFGQFKMPGNSLSNWNDFKPLE
jgi:hypothetical protein